MSVPLPRPYPDSRVLEAWWGRLAPAGATGLWVGPLLLHRVEAPVHVRATPDHVSRLLLETLGAGSTAAEVAGRLALTAAAAEHLLSALALDGFAARNGSGIWSPTPEGAAARAGSAPLRVFRRVFHFCEAGERVEPQYVNLRHAASPCAPPPGWRFDPVLLTACMARPRAWKSACDFPPDVEPSGDLGEVATAPDGEQAWARVLLDTPVRLNVALVRRSDGVLAAYAVEPPAWELPETAAFSLRPPCTVLADEPPASAWRQALRDWGRVAGFPATLIEGCRFERVGHRLCVGAAGSVAERIRRGFAGGSAEWILAGGPRLRAAARLEFTRLS